MNQENHHPRLLHLALTGILITGLLIGSLPALAVAQSGESGDVVGRPDISFATGSGTVSAGTTSEMEISVVNRGMIIQHGPSQYEDSVMTARGLTFEPQDDNTPIDIHAGQVSIGNFQTGSTQQTVSVTVPDDTEPGTYQIPIKYTYSHTRHISYDANGRDEGSDSTRTETDSLTIRVGEDARFEVVESNATAQIGDDSDISMVLRNTGSEIAKRASVTAESKSSSVTFESADTTSTTFVGDWQPGEVRNITYNVGLESDASLREYTLDLTVKYNDVDGISRTSESISAAVKSIPEQSFTFDNVASSLRVGENGAVTGTIENTGPNPVKSVAIHPAENLSAIVPGEESVVVGSLDSGEAKSFRLPIEVTTEGEPGEKLIGLDVQYRDGDGDQRTYDNRDVSVSVGSERDKFKLSVTDQTITTGGTQTLAVEVTNNLNETVTDIDARMFADDPLNTGDTDTSYIEALEPGESTTVQFDVSASSSVTVGNTYPVSFDFRYTDSRGNTHLSDTLRYPLNAVQSTNSGGPPLALLGGAAVLVLGGAAVLYRRYN